MQLLAQSAHSEVYRLDETLESPPVVLKVLKPSPDLNVGQERLNREFQITQDLNLRAVRHARQKTSWEGRPALLLDYVTGVSLRTFLAESPPDLNTSLKIALELSRKLMVLHEQGIVHLSLCPEHVLIQPEALTVTLIGLGQSQYLNELLAQVTAVSELELNYSYMAPEQSAHSGLMPDPRSDLYSLGVVLYELFTGQVPFVGAGPQELIYAHQVLSPPSPLDFLPAELAVRTTLAKMLLTLLAKDPVDRYQSAGSLVQDLDRCWQAYQEHQELPDFEPAAWERAARLTLSEQLFGREREQDWLQQKLSALPRQNQAQLILLRGPSGCGKSRLQAEAMGWFSEGTLLQGGKYEQQGAPIPYQALIQTLNAWLRQILLSEAEVIELWKNRLQEEASTELLRPLLALLPQWEILLGSRPREMNAEPESPRARQEQIKNAVLQFFRILCRFEAPILICIDDLQWADASSLDWLSWLLNAEALAPLAILASAREEVEEGTPFAAWLGDLEHQESLMGRAMDTVVQELKLLPLSLGAIQDWLEVSLHLSSGRAETLAAKVQYLSQGNAFELRQQVQHLYAMGVLWYSREQQSWEWDLRRLETAPDEDEPDLLQTTLAQLTPQAQTLLHWAAILGRGLSLDEWAHISGLKAPVVQGVLPQFLKLAWIQIQEGQFHFQHDRFQQSILDSLSPEQQAQMHLQLGRQWLAQHLSGEAEEAGESDLMALYETLFHLNLVAPLIQEQPERLQVARLNLRAAQAARQDSAYEACLDFATAGLRFLPARAWELEPDLSFALTLRSAEARTVLDQFEAAQEQFELLWHQARNSDEKCQISNLQLVYYSQKNWHQAGMRLFVQRLAQEGFPLPDQPLLFWGQIGRRVLWLRRFVRQKSLDELQNLPFMQASQPKLQVQLMADAMDSLVVMNDIPKILWNAVQIGGLSFEYGHRPISSLSYVQLAVLFLIQFKDRESAEKLVALARFRSEQNGDLLLQAKVQTSLTLFFQTYMLPLSVLTRELEAERRLFEQAGETLLSFYNIYVLATCRLVQGLDLQLHLRQLERDYHLLAAHHHDMGCDLLQNLQLAPLRCLMGKIGSSDLLATPLDLREKFTLEMAQQELGHKYLMLAYLLGDEVALQRWTELGFDKLKQPMRIWDFVEGYFFLILASLSLARRGPQFQSYAKRARNLERRFQTMARRFPVNLQWQARFLSAELQAHDGQILPAIQDFERLMAEAEAAHNLFWLGLAARRAGEWALEAGLRSLAGHYLQRAQRSYAFWGAQALVQDLAAAHPDLCARPLAGTSERSQAPLTAQLDWEDLMQAALLLAEESEQSGLLKKFLHLLGQHAGAEYGALLLTDEDRSNWFLEATWQALEDRVHLERQPLSRLEPVSLGLIREVMQTAEPLIVSDARTELKHIQGAYLQEPDRAALRSLLILPLLRQGQLIGLVYLEHRHSAGVFRSEHLEALKVLAAQAAIALSHARLYQELQGQNEDLEQKVKDRTEALARANEELQTRNAFLDQLNRVKDEFLNMVSHDLKNPLNSILLFSRYMESRRVSEAKVREIGGMISRAGQRMFSLLEDLLDLNRLEQKKLKLNLEPLDWGHEIQLLVADFEAMACEKKQRLRFLKQVNSSLLQADTARLRQIVENLVSNALKFSPPGCQVTLILEQRPGSAGPELLLSVLDQGPGLSAEEQTRLFQAFVKLSPQPTGGESSSGLGLSIAYQLAEAMGGKLWCESQLGEGSTFVLSFPALRVSAES